jgi:hypothetical protein
MSMTVGELVAYLRVNDTQFNRGVDSAGKKWAGFGKSLAKGGAIAALTAGAAGLAAAVKTGWGEMMDASAVTAQLKAGIKSTGNAANVTVKGMQDLAARIQDYSGQTDDSIAAAESLLLTFTNIKNVGADKIFDQATIAAADMAAKLGGDASGSAIQLGKALNDPVKGVTALQRVGVAFTEAQKAQIKAMVESGDVMGAQKMILKELNTEFGGAAKAAGGSLPGRIERLKRKFETFSESLMRRVVPAVVSGMEGIGVAFGAVEAFFEQHGPAIKKAFADAWAEVGPTLTGVARAVYAVVSGIVSFIRDHWNRIGPIVFGVLNFVKTYIISYLRVIRDIINVAMALLRGDWGEAWNALKRLVVDAVTGILNTLKAYVTMWRAVLVAGLAALVGVGRNAMAGLLGGIKSGGAAVVGWFAALPQAICKQLVGLYNIMTQFGKLVAEGFIAGLGSLAGAVWQKVKDVFWTPINWAKSMLGINSPSKVTHEMGFNVARGFAGGLLAGAGGAQSAIGRVMAVGGIAVSHTGGGSVAHGSSPLGGSSTGLTINILGDIVGVDVDDLTSQIVARIGLEQRRLSRGLA